MQKENLHTHTVFSDGRNSPRELVDRALELGFTALGFSDHSYTSIDTEYCMKREVLARYQKIVRSLSEEYAGKLRILFGIEQDYFSDDPPAGFDYVIGSVHYVVKDGQCLPVDKSPRDFIKNILRCYAGDVFAFCRDYYALVRGVAEKTDADVIGHFDLVGKFNEGDRMFDPEDKRYTDPAIDAADALLETGLPFEINTGAMARGYRSSPYPSEKLIEYIASRGGRFILSSDCHDAELLDYGFSEIEEKYGRYLITSESIRFKKHENPGL